jgi:signal transduction histidine kinase
MNKLANIFTRIVGEKKNRDPERYFVTITCFFASIFLMILCVVHVIMNLKLAPVFFAGGSSIVLMMLYYLVRFRECLFYPKLALTVWGLVMLDFTWYAKFLSNGPVLFFLMIFGALVIWVWEGRQLATMLGLYFLNVIVLFLIDYYTPDHLLEYPDLRSRTVDIYLSFFMYAMLLVFLLYIVKKEFTRQKDMAVQSDKLKSAFLANMSHEIRTPMNAIVGFSQLLNSEENSNENEHYTSIIQNSSENLLRLIDDIIDLSKIEAGDMEIKYTDFNIKMLFDELKELFQAEINKKEKTEIILDYELPDGDIMLSSDLLRLKQVLSNLLANAIKFTLRGKIMYSCRKRNNDLVFAVSDTGIGINEEDQKKIFGQFTNFNYQGLNYEGSGIGLAIVERIVNLLNGHVWVESIPGKGSSFYFSIPHFSPLTRSKRSQPVQKKHPGTDNKAGKIILIVEDNELSSMVLKEMLKSSNYRYHHVRNGEEAIRYVKENPGIALILIDMKLPGMDGYQTTKLIKKFNPEISIVAQTAFAMSGDREKALKSGCDDYLSKPIDLERLMLVLKTYMSN